MPAHPDARIDAAKGFIDPGAAADDGPFARDDARLAELVRRDESGGEILSADILGQRPLDLRWQIGGRRVDQNGSPCEGPIMHMSIGKDSRKLVREARVAILRALAFSSSVAGLMPSTFF